MDKRRFEKNAVLKCSFDFALMVIAYCEVLQKQGKYIICNQLLKAGTSIGANILEEQNSESKNDFIHKLKIAAKEQRKHNIGFGFGNVPIRIPIAKVCY